MDIPDTEDESLTQAPRRLDSGLKRKDADEEEEPEGKPTLGRRAPSNRPSRKDRMFAALARLDDNRLKSVLSQMPAEELALAMLEAEPQVLERVKAALEGDHKELFQQYLALGDDKIPSSTIDSAQGKLLRLSN